MTMSEKKLREAWKGGIWLASLDKAINKVRRKNTVNGVKMHWKDEVKWASYEARHDPRVIEMIKHKSEKIEPSKSKKVDMERE